MVLPCFGWELVCAALSLLLALSGKESREDAVTCTWKTKMRLPTATAGFPTVGAGFRNKDEGCEEKLRLNRDSEEAGASIKGIFGGRSSSEAHRKVGSGRH